MLDVLTYPVNNLAVLLQTVDWFCFLKQNNFQSCCNMLSSVVFLLAKWIVLFKIFIYFIFLHSPLIIPITKMLRINRMRARVTHVSMWHIWVFLFHVHKTALSKNRSNFEKVNVAFLFVFMHAHWFSSNL